MRVKFSRGKQREFFDSVIIKLNCISLRGLLQFGFKISYDSLKNYYNERRLLPKEFFEDLCYLSKINRKKFNVGYYEDSWGKSKGGKKSKRVKGLKINKS